MRSFLLSVATVLFFSFTQAQTIPNGGFENWIPNPIGANEIPQYWFGDFNTAQTIAKDTDVFVGDYCMRVMSRLQGFEGLLPGHISTRVAAASLEGELNCMISVDTVEHYDGDTSYAIIVIDTSENYNWGSTESIAHFKMIGATPNYVGVNIPFVLPAGTDSFYVHVAAQNVITPLASGGYVSFRVDEMNVTFEPNGLVEIQNENAFTAYPNPANDVLFVNSKHEIARFELCDVSGRVVVNGLVEQNKIDVSQVAEGNYLLRLKAKDGTTIGTTFTTIAR